MTVLSIFGIFLKFSTQDL